MKTIVLLISLSMTFSVWSEEGSCQQVNLIEKTKLFLKDGRTIGLYCHRKIKKSCLRLRPVVLDSNNCKIKLKRRTIKKMAKAHLKSAGTKEDHKVLIWNALLVGHPFWMTAHGLFAPNFPYFMLDLVLLPISIPVGIIGLILAPFFLLS